MINLEIQLTKLRDVGQVCLDIQNEHLLKLPSKNVQRDEIWSFVYTENKIVRDDKKYQFGFSDEWTWVAIDADTKFVPCWHFGVRNNKVTKNLIGDLARRLANCFYLTTDGHNP